ncbi:hypothetical protein [Streptomyces sp. NPDC048603]|uniref:hypothetical protein n=1 Tax=Streptomyces sp. NPDC048603 TaxID=3365577 RepID=UPI003722A7A3
MSVSAILAVVLGVALIAAIAVLVATEIRSKAAPRPALTPAVTGREALDAIDLGLRRLAADCERTQRSMPDLYALGYSAERLTLRLSGADAKPPAAWTAGQDGEEWYMAADELGTYAPHEAPGPSQPYALAVTLGLTGGERVLVDLSRSQAAIVVTGESDGVKQLVRAMLSELITGPVGRQATVTLVGSVATTDVTAGLGLQSARLHTVATLEEALADAAYSGTAPRVATADGDDSARLTQMFRLIEGHRPLGVQGTIPHLFVMDAAQYRDEQAGTRSVRPGDALLVVGDAPDFGWRLTVLPDGRVDTGPLGIGLDVHAGRTA